MRNQRDSLLLLLSTVRSCVRPASRCFPILTTLILRAAPVPFAASCASNQGEGYEDSLEVPTDAGSNNDDDGSPSHPKQDAGLGTAVLGSAALDDDASVAGCATDMEQAKEVPLDLYFMLDTSGSMNDLIAERQSKWNAVTAAIGAFVTDPASSGLAVGLQYFPVPAEGLGTSCVSDAQCGASGPCTLRFCDDGSGSPCRADADCAGFLTACVPIAACQYDVNVLCDSPGETCGTDANGFSLGLCERAPGQCANGDSCVDRDYAAPSVAVAPLPAAAGAILASLAARSPAGATPTAAALQGAIEGARSYASANPGHQVVAVLATDGMPNEVFSDATGACIAAPGASPLDSSPADTQVAQVAAAGLAGTPSVRTFGIGVFAPEDAASGTSALDALASAGGTTPPFIIGTATSSQSQSVEDQFIDALNAIRGSSLPCQYQLPSPQSGVPDLSRVNVRFTASTGVVSTIPYVAGATGCDPAGGGWYYNVDPSEGGAPTMIDACPATCSALKADGAGRVGIVVGCRTLLP